MLQINDSSKLKVKKVIAKHYGVNDIDDEELNAEIANLNRRYENGTMDDFYENLYYAIDIIVNR